MPCIVDFKNDKRLIQYECGLEFSFLEQFKSTLRGFDEQCADIKYIEINYKTLQQIPPEKIKVVDNKKYYDCSYVSPIKIILNNSLEDLIVGFYFKDDFFEFNKEKKRKRIIETLDRLESYSNKECLEQSGIDIEKVKAMVKSL